VQLILPGLRPFLDWSHYFIKFGTSLIRSLADIDILTLPTTPRQCYQNQTGTNKTGWSNRFRGLTSPVQGSELEMAGFVWNQP
jgi:hypothetical protein